MAFVEPLSTIFAILSDEYLARHMLEWNVSQFGMRFPAFARLYWFKRKHACKRFTVMREDHFAFSFERFFKDFVALADFADAQGLHEVMNSSCDKL